MHMCDERFHFLVTFTMALSLSCRSKPTYYALLGSSIEWSTFVSSGACSCMQTTSPPLTSRFMSRYDCSCVCPHNIHKRHSHEAFQDPGDFPNPMPVMNSTLYLCHRIFLIIHVHMPSISICIHSLLRVGSYSLSARHAFERIDVPGFRNQSQTRHSP